MTDAYLENVLCKNALRCGSVSSEAQMKGLYIEDLLKSIRQNFRNAWSIHVDPELGEIKRYAT